MRPDADGNQLLADPTGSVSRPVACDQLAALKQAVHAARTLPEVQRAIADHLRRQLNSPLCVWYWPPGEQIGQAARLEGLLCPVEGLAEGLRKHLLELAGQTVECRQPCIVTVPGRSNLQLLATPLASPVGHCLLVAVESVIPITPDSRPALWLSLVGTLVEDWFLCQRSAASQAESEAVAAMIELISHVFSAVDADEACHRLADMLSEHLHATQVFVGLCHAGGSMPRLTAVSGRRQFDPQDDETRLIEAVLHESTARAAGAVWPGDGSASRHALLSHQQFAEARNCGHVVSMPLFTSAGERCGAIVATLASESVSDSAACPAVAASRFLHAAALPLAGCLEVVRKLADGRWIMSLRRCRRLVTRQKLRTAGLISLALGAALLVPVPYTIPCTGELQPVERRYVAAPFAGPLEECLVEPGDLVRSDQLLARMDGREIRWELAGVQADLNKATKERNTHLSTHEFGSAAIARHEVQRLQHRTDLLRHRDEHLEIRSPIDGIVVSGDHREAEGVPLQQGQTLFEVAPLERMVVEIGIPEADIRHAAEGQTISLQLEAIPEQPFEAVLRRIHPRAELQDNRNVFVAEAELENSELRLRPGMRGEVRLVTAARPLGWNLFHKPAAHLLGWLGW